MKQKFIIVLVIQTILIAMFFAYALVQRLHAQKQAERADELVHRVEEREIKSIELYNELNKEVDRLKEELKGCRQGNL